ncbi:MAG: hypothetical protein QOG73_212 [Acetobacteraceae bacterium]|nr:hypothetical protein [Acetobacteraceae bacterium]
MRGHFDQSKMIAAIFPFVAVAGGIFLVSGLPNDWIAILTAWVLGSVPIGLLIGNCVLNEE